ncbi:MULTISPECIES: adenylate/guanylate cyclase domain-containing protein [unclassified Rhizobium]|uniref:adenylate/guanylate cyclase domain-containing protein n=1 Tax=unclassified Rhizobium TaxID=2613769 RepID=UPI00288B9A82|nr:MULTISPECIES: adenylate/guanylate cyclase domain-containing protein [unclassified Rhizobium]
MTNIDNLINWILAEGTLCDDPAVFADGLALRLVEAGMPVHYLEISAPSLHPLHQVAKVIWRYEEGIKTETMAYGAVQDLAFESSPINYLLADKREAGRWDLQNGEATKAFPQLQLLSREGLTDFVLRIVRFRREAVLLGMAVSCATRDMGGFNNDQLGQFDRILPALGLAVHRMVVSRMASDVLRFYVGSRTSTRILGGEIRRGHGQSIYAAILLADLKDFTGLNERFPPDNVVRWLNEHFEVIGSSIEHHGGEIMKLMGDSVLSIFPVGQEHASAFLACSKALAAAQSAILGTDALNKTRANSRDPEIKVDFVLHLGEVFYGNIGAAQRLDFTVIGRVVNEAARLESLCERLERQMLISSSFAEHCNVSLEPLGTFQLKGVAEPQVVYGLAPTDQDPS